MCLPYIGMGAILINGQRPFVQIFNPPLTEGYSRNLKKIGLGDSEEKLFKGVDGRTADRQRTEQSSGELKNILLKFLPNRLMRGHNSTDI